MKKAVAGSVARGIAAVGKAAMEPSRWPVPRSWWFYRMTLDWRFPVIVALVYTVVATFFSRRNIAAIKAAGGKPAASSGNEWSLLKAAIVAHNVVLALFSAKTLWETAPVLARGFFARRTLTHWFCDLDGTTTELAVGFWTWVFYLSKYYELLDTAILLVKGRPSSFLQTFHHAGAIIGMWMLAATGAFGSWVFVVFNSFIHTCMYTYYTLTALGYRPSWKQLMTYMQIAQFCVGLPLAVLYVIVPNCVLDKPTQYNELSKLMGINGYWSQVAALSFNFVYVSYLIVLFLDFARRTYSAAVKSRRQKLKAM